jgi:hypothetical protein
MSIGNIPANSNSTGYQNMAPNAPMSNFPSMNQTLTNNETAENSANPSAFKPKRKTPIKVILGAILFVLLLIGGSAGLYLTQMQQDVRQQASTNTAYPPAQCLPLEAACGSERGLSNTCCGNGVCQGTHNNRRCEDAQNPIDSFCTGGGTCSGYYGFRCNSLHTSPSSSGQLVCEQNPSQLFTGPSARASALAYAGQCGQIDQVCVGGDKQGQLCGEFSIINNSCGGGDTPPTNPPSPSPSPSPRVTPSPVPSPTPSPSPILSCNSICTTDAQCQSVDPRFVCYQPPMPDCPEGLSCVQVMPPQVCRLASNPTSTTCQPTVGPMCMSITLNNLSNPRAGTADPEIGDAITLTCGQVNSAASYIFRILQPDGSITNLAATGRTSESFTITQSGRHLAQCQICTGATAATCLPYEPFARE